MKRYIRNFSSISYEQQEVIRNSTVAIVGLGGLGGYVLENLVRLGVKGFHLIDKDVFEESNLNRQILSTELNLGKSKAYEALKRAQSIDHEVRAKVFNAQLDEDSIHMLQGADIIVDCLDSIEGRFKLEELCDKLDLTLIHGAIRGYYGQISVSSKDNRIYKKIYGSCEKDQESMGNLPMTCMIIASFQVNLLLKILFGEEIEKELIIIDVREMEIDKLKL